MRSPGNHAILLLGLAALAPGCASPVLLHPEAAPVTLEVAAFLCADVCRTVFAAADPLPYHAGAPATRLPGGGYEVRYDRRADGRWTPRAAGRLIARPDRDPTRLPVIRYERASGLGGFRAASATVIVRIDPGADGAVIGARVVGAELEPLLQHLAHAVRFVASLPTDEVEPPCCARHAPWQARSFALAARGHLEAGRLLAARDALRAVEALRPGQRDLDFHIGRLDRLLGQDELAGPRLLTASRSAGDPLTRAAAARQARRSLERARGGDRGELLRRDAERQFAAGNLASAAALAHEARAADPDPVADLELRHRLLREREDHFGALGTALLLREYGGGPGIDRMLAHDFGRMGHDQLARRAALRTLAGELPRSPLLRAVRRAGAELAQLAERAGLLPPAGGRPGPDGLARPPR